MSTECDVRHCDDAGHLSGSGLFIDGLPRRRLRVRHGWQRS